MESLERRNFPSFRASECVCVGALALLLVVPSFIPLNKIRKCAHKLLTFSRIVLERTVFCRSSQQPSTASFSIFISVVFCHRWWCACFSHRINLLATASACGGEWKTMMALACTSVSVSFTSTEMNGEFSFPVAASAPQFSSARCGNKAKATHTASAGYRSSIRRMAACGSNWDRNNSALTRASGNALNESNKDEVEKSVENERNGDGCVAEWKQHQRRRCVV